MMYSYRIEQAIRAASVLHRDQQRKGPAPYPYISHLFAVGCIIADYTTDEDIIIAGLLHDTLEETDYTEQELEIDFGSRVRTIVVGVTEQKGAHPTYTWSDMKDTSIEALSYASEESLIVAAADTIHNLRSIIEEYQFDIEGYMADFSGSLDERLKFYGKKSEILNQRLENPILNEFNHVFTEYQQFILSGNDSIA